MDNINIQSNLEIKEGKLNVTHFEYNLLFFKRKCITYLLFEDISSISIINSYLKWIFWVLSLICFLGLFQTCSSVGFYNSPEESSNFVSIIFMLILAVSFFVLGYRQKEELIRIETRGGNFIWIIPENNPIELIEKIEEMKEKSFRK
jgi:hypothetical protein